jgi:hypothetical protein
MAISRSSLQHPHTLWPATISMEATRRTGRAGRCKGLGLRR